MQAAMVSPKDAPKIRELLRVACPWSITCAAAGWYNLVFMSPCILRLMHLVKNIRIRMRLEIQDCFAK